MTKEQRFVQLLKGYITSVNIKKDNVLLELIKDSYILLQLDLKTGYLWVNWYKIWSIFEKEYNLNDTEIQSFVKDQVEHHFKWKEVTPPSSRRQRQQEVEHHFKWKEVTPVPDVNRNIHRVEHHFKWKEVTPAAVAGDTMYLVEHHFKWKEVTPSAARG